MNRCDSGMNPMRSIPSARFRGTIARGVSVNSGSGVRRACHGCTLRRFKLRPYRNEMRSEHVRSPCISCTMQQSHEHGVKYSGRAVPGATRRASFQLRRFAMKCAAAFNIAPSLPNERDRLFSLGDKRLEPLPRTIDPQQAQECRLVGGRIFSRRLADGRCIAFDIEQVIGDLKGFADRRTVTFERRPRLCAGASPSMAPLEQANFRSAPVFIDCSSFYVAEVKLASPAICKSAFGRKIEHLPAGHSADAGGSRKRGNELNSDVGLWRVFAGARGYRRRRSKGHRLPGLRLLRRRPYERSAFRGATRRRPSREGRRERANSSARTRARRQPSALAVAARRIVSRFQRPEKGGSACRPRGLRNAWPPAGGRAR